MSSFAHRILLVEDDESVALGIADVLELEHMRVDVVTTGRAAIAAIDAAPPDVVILDMRLPDMEGTAIYAEIIARRPEVAVIFSTGNADRSKLQTLLDHPKVGYLVKPYDISTLLEVIRHLLSR